MNANNFKNLLNPYFGIIYFMVLLFGSHFLWSVFVEADLYSQQIAMFGIDMTSVFHELSRIISRLAQWFIGLFPGSETFRVEDTILYFTDGKIKLNIIWGCTGVKQMYIFLAIMLLYFGPIKKKIWYIPMGCILLFMYNIFRIACICWLTKNHPERFDFLHEGLFKYIYYGLIFLLWVVWEETIVKKRKKVTKK